MSTKKTLYKPAPEIHQPKSALTLPQGNVAAVNSTAPAIKQGILERTLGGKPLTSTLKPSARKPDKVTKAVVVRHKPSAVHSHIASQDGPDNQLAKDTVCSPCVVPIQDMSTKKAGVNTQKVTKQKGSATKARFVESRYKNHLTSRHHGAGHSTHNSGSFNNNSSTNKSRPDLTGSYSLQTPTVKKAPGKTSTPACKTAQQSFDWNASAIERNCSVSAQSPEDAFHGQDRTFSKSDETEEPDLEIMYMQYLQWHYLNLKVKVAEESKAKQAASELKFLREKHSKLRSDVEQLEKESEHIAHHIDLEKQLQQQSGCLGPVLDKIQPSLDQHHTLVSNLDTTRHNLPLSGVSDPDQEALEGALDETRHLLGQINILTHSQAPGVEAMSRSSKALDDRCTEEARLVPAAEKLIHRELSAVLKQASLAGQLRTSEQRVRETAAAGHAHSA